MAEQIISDFSGGMNALAAVDKCAPNECLLAENVRLDETGNVQSAGAFTALNTVAYAAAGGTNTNYVHSHFYLPSLGAVAGIGQDVFIGPTLGAMSSKLAAQNPQVQKMSFGAAPTRVYFDVASAGYWTDQTNLLTVDWAPPNAASGTVTGPAYVGTSSQSGGGVSWTNPGALSTTTATAQAFIPGNQSASALWGLMTTNSFSVGSTNVSGITVSFQAAVGVITMPFPGSTEQATFTVYLLRDGIPIGSARMAQPVGGFLVGTVQTWVAGNATDTWDAMLGSDDVNAGNFGIFISVSNPNSPGTIIGGFDENGLIPHIFGAQITINQAATGGGMVAATGTTGTLTGTYMWKCTFVAQNGEESDGSSDTAPVVLSGSQGTLTAIPTGDARTAARNIYRIGGALTVHYLVGSIQDNASTTYSDNLTDLAALSEGVILAGDVPGDYPNTRLGNITAQVRFPVYHYDRVFWININQPNQLIWSKPLNAFAYPAVNFLDVGNSSPIARHVSIFGELIIIKQDGTIWTLTGTDESSFDLSQTPANVGTDQAFTIAAMPDRVPFANRFGLWVFNGYSSVSFTHKLDLWFKQLDRTGASLFGVNGFHPPEVVNSAATQNFEAVANSEKFVMAYAETGQSLNNAILVSDVKHNNITKRQLGDREPLSLSLDPTTGYVYVGDSNGFISLLDDWNGAAQVGSPSNFDFQTPYYDFERGSNKSLWAVEFFVNTNGQSLTPYVYYDNGANGETLAPFSTSGLQRVVRPVEASNARKAQNWSVRLNGSINPINVNGTPQIELVHVKMLYDVRVGRSRTGQ